MDDSSLDFGAQLAAARKLSGLTLDDVAKRTKIRPSVLVAIERCDVAALPGGLYTRAFLRAYARQVGCDPEEIVGKYRERFHEHVLTTEAMTLADAGLSVSCQSGQVSVAEIDAQTRRWRAAWISGSAVLIATSVLYLVAQSNTVKMARGQSSSSRSDIKLTSAATPGAVATTGTVTANRPGVAAPTDSSVAARSDAGELRLDLKPTSECWLAAKADGRSVLYRLMSAGERAQIQAREEVVLTLGDPAGCGFDINGAAARQLGAAGKPVTVHLTPKNFAEFLQQ
jgi:cytoskeleton protein RodZ